MSESIAAIRRRRAGDLRTEREAAAARLSRNLPVYVTQGTESVLSFVVEVIGYVAVVNVGGTGRRMDFPVTSVRPAEAFETVAAGTVTI